MVISERSTSNRTPMNISIVIPTIGRPGLLRSILSLSCQLQGGDELIVVTDGDSPEASRIVKKSGVQCSVFKSNYPETRCGHRCGNAAREYGMLQATKEILMFLDDDDIFLPGSISLGRSAIENSPNTISIFRMVDQKGRTLWKSKSLTYGNVGTPMLVIPNNKERFGRWGLRSGGDFDFTVSTVAKYPPGSVIWREEVICLCRPS